MMDAALAFRVTDVTRQGRPSRRSFQSVHWFDRTAHTSTASSVEEPPSSAAASTDEVTTRWLEPVVERLIHLLQLQDGWNGPGSLSVDRGVAIKTVEVLGQIATGSTRPPSISPGADGSLQLAWYAREFELEIDVPRAGDPTASLYEHNSGQELELTLTSPELNAAIERLAGD
jgi:hypothetical protein